MKLIKKLISLSLVGVVLILCLMISVVVYANSAEIFSKKDIVFANALTSYPELPIAEKHLFVLPNSDPNLSGNLIGDFGKPISLNIPSIRRKLEIVPAIVRENTLLVRPNNGHFLVRFDEKAVKDFLIYLNKSWRTLPSPEDIKRDTNLYIDTNRKWRYVFKIEEIVSLTEDSIFVIPDNKTTNLILIINYPLDRKFLIVRAGYRTVVPIEK